MAGDSYPGAMRASDDDRSKVQAMLNDAYAEGRLNQQEWDQRAAELASATTYAELDRLTADLPGHSLRPQYPSSPPQPWQPRQRTNKLAVAALVCGVGQLFFWWPATIAAIALGHNARRQIRQTGEEGDGLARAGLILGYAGLGLSLLVVLLVVAVFTSSSQG